MKKIKLTQGKFALVDNEDYEWLNQWKWSFDGDYALRRETVMGIKVTYMHRLILGLINKNNIYADHVDGNGLNNTRKNLRIVTKSQNAMNMKMHSNNISGFKGVSFDKNRKKWKAVLMLNRKQIYLGRFLNKKEAAQIYNQAALKYFGEFARLNQI